MLLQRFQDFIRSQHLFSKDEKILLAVSGGVDSMVMAHLFKAAELSYGIAHCNFMLRGEASELDAALVENWAKEQAIDFHQTRFATQSIAEERKTSIQLVARELRYKWLEAIRQEYTYAYLATAHHVNDSIETFLYNFSKGTGLKGLLGIPLQQGNIIRPLLFTDRATIAEYANIHKVPFREDASNQSVKYARNKIRKEVWPVLLDLNPRLTHTSRETFDNLNETAALFNYFIHQIKEKAMEQVGNQTIIALPILQQYPAQSTLLFECLRPFAFPARQISKILNSTTKSGSIFLTPTHRVLKNRDQLVIEPRKEEERSQSFEITAQTAALQTNTAMFLITEGEEKNPTIPVDPTVALLDKGQLQFPLRLRHWKPGDYFYPLGMNGKRQKVQDFFSNNKISRFEKEKVWILETGKEEICWIVGWRIDDRFKIRPTTEEYLLIQCDSLKETL